MSLLDMSLAALPLLLATLVARAALLRRLPKRTFVALWGVALLRLLVPVEIPFLLSIRTLTGWAREHFFTPEAPATLPDAAPSAFTAQTVYAPSGGLSMAAETAPQAAGETAAALLPVWAWVWLLGACLLAAVLLVSYCAARRRFADAVPAKAPHIGAWQAAHPLRRPLQVRVSDRIDGPLTYGVLHPVILLPTAALTLPAAQLDAILTHEYIHIRRFDTLLKRLFAVALCLHWPNPLVWLMVLLAGRDIEMACDEAAIRSVGFAQRKNYALTLINMEETRGRTAPLVASFSQYATEERIQAIMKMKPASLTGTMLAILLVVMMTLLFATAAGATGAPVQSKDTATAAGTLSSTTSALTTAPAETTTIDREVLLAEYEALLAQYRALLAASGEGVPTDTAGDVTVSQFVTDPDSVSITMRSVPAVPADADALVPALHAYSEESGVSIQLNPAQGVATESWRAVGDTLVSGSAQVTQSYPATGESVPAQTIRFNAGEGTAVVSGAASNIASAGDVAVIQGRAAVSGVYAETVTEHSAQETYGMRSSYSATLAIGDRMVVEIGPYETEAELRAAAEAYLRAQVAAGLISAGQMEQILADL